jgi:4-hydroxy-4-methyl-2-oxoglutarate aldolase
MATEIELERVRPRLFGLIAEERIAAVDIERPSADSLKDFHELTDLSPAVSDALDELGVGGSAPGSTLVPLSDGQRIVGPAITIRYVAHGGNIGAVTERGERGGLADRDMYNIGQAGDVGVFDCGGYTAGSVIGGLSAAWARRVELAGCVVDGAIRDVEGIRDGGLPIWSRGRTPASGKHRVAAAEINGVVSIAGMVVRPGDVIVADGSGVCVIPIEYVDEVKEIALEAERAERKLTAAIGDGASIEDVARILRPEKW